MKLYHGILNLSRDIEDFCPDGFGFPTADRATRHVVRKVTFDPYNLFSVHRQELRKDMLGIQPVARRWTVMLQFLFLIRPGWPFRLAAPRNRPLRPCQQRSITRSKPYPKGFYPFETSWYESYLSQLLLKENPSSTTTATTDSSCSSSIDDTNDAARRNERILGLAVLLTVPLAWGTYTPVVKYLYAIEPPVPGFVFSAAYYTLAALTLSFLAFIQNYIQNRQSNVVSDADDTTPMQTSTSNQNTSLEQREEMQVITENIDETVLGGLELGSYLFIGNVLQVIGLQTVAADRAGFLVQLTTVFVPIVQAMLAGGNQRTIPVRTWIACCVAFIGVIVINADGSTLVNLQNEALEARTMSKIIENILNGFTVGDLLIVMAAIVYSVHVVRLGRYATTAPSTVALAATKATTEAILSICLVVLLISIGGPLNSVDQINANNAGLLGFSQHLGLEITSFFSTVGDSLASGNIPTSALYPAIGATIWTGLITSAYTIYAQAFGQSRHGVTPTDANLVYTLQPLFTAMFAFILLGETLGPAGVLGGSLIGGAVYFVASSEDPTQDMDSFSSDSYFAEKSAGGIIVEERQEELSDRKA